MDHRSEIEVRWLDWRDAGEEILGVRRRVFTDELGWREHRIHHDRDPDGLHLCAISGGKIVAVISAYVYEPGAPELAVMELPDTDGPTVEIGKRVGLPTHRGSLISAELATSMVRQICEALRPSRFFLIVRVSEQPHLIERYARRNFVYHTEVGSGDDAVAVMKVEGEEALEEFYLKHRDLARDSSDGSPVFVPSLARFLVENGRDDLLAVERLAVENHYLELLAIQTEAPRLTAQGRLILAEQRPRLASTPFPPAPASLLDIGTGPGEYLAAIAKEEPLAGYRVQGVEPAPQLLVRARSNFPEYDFRQGTAYTTGEPDSSHDVVTAHFLFVHLRSLDLALLEMRRILRRGGLLYVVDVNDAGFSAPEVIQRVVKAYDRNYVGDRLVMNDLPDRAEEFGFQLVRRFATTLGNTGDAQPIFDPDRIRLGHADAWNLLSFVRSQSGIEQSFKEAQDHYFSTECEISIPLETQVYQLSPTQKEGPGRGRRPPCRSGGAVGEDLGQGV
ncbi:methyltransferase domain-containing protein [Sphaerisporangium viridialbum]|uniref:methyltransferase domain-containing protein n=1 Tax=Sphaerisporangium viridialbum TaxID=46189 RepID=UPI003C78A3E1